MYYIDAEQVSLADLRKRIEETDLVPSRISLLENISEKFMKLQEHGIKTLADLRKALKNAKNIPQHSNETGIDNNYLILLRREIEGYFPKAFPLRSFDWLDKKNIELLEKNGFKNTLMLHEALNSKEKSEIINILGIDADFIDSLFNLVNLTRIQWTSPLFARMLVSVGYTNSKMVSEADAEILCDKLDKKNKEDNYFKGKIGLRDIKRLIKAASYVP